MYIYILNFLLFLSMFSLDFKKNKKSIKIFMLTIANIYLVIIAGFRIGIGADYYQYLNLYKRVTLEHSTRMEPFITSLIIITPNFRLFLLSFAILSISIKLYLIKKYSPYIFISLFMYITFFFIKNDMSVIRIGLANGIAFYSLHFLSEKKYLKYVAIIILSTLVQRTTIIYLLLIPIWKIDWDKKKMFSLLLLSFSIGMININSILKKIFFRIPWVLKNYNYYYESSKGYSEKIGLTLGMVPIFFFTVVFIINYKKLTQKYKYFRVLFLSYFTGANIYFLFNSFSIVATRGSEIFTCVYYFLFPYLLGTTKKKSNKIVIIIILILYSLYLNFYTLNIRYFLPYKIGISV